MKEFDKEFHVSLGLDPNKIESKTVDMDEKVVVMGKCPDFNDSSSRECFWRRYGQLPIGED